MFITKINQEQKYMDTVTEIESKIENEVEKMEEEKYNIVGIVVNTRIDEQDKIQAVLDATDGVEICATESGKLVITIDDLECEQPLIDTITQINNIPGVLATSIAYHHFEGDLAIQEKQV